MLLTVLMFSALGALLLMGAILWLYVQDELLTVPWAFQAGQDFWMVYSPGGTLSLIREWIIGLLGTLIALFGGFWIRRYFQRTAGTESFYLAAFFFLTALDSLKLAVPWLDQAGFSYLLVAVFSRVILGLRMAALMTLAGAGLHGLGLEHQKPGQVVLALMVLGQILMFSWPLDSQFLTSALLVKTAQEGALVFTQLLLMASVPLMYLAAGHQMGSSKKYKEAGILGGIILGTLGTWFMPWRIPGFIVLGLGILLLIMVRREEVDWI